MTVAVKLDEDLSEPIAAPLVERGHAVATVVRQGWGGLKDHELWPRVLAENRMLITADKGFGDIRAYPPGKHPGIILLRPDRESLLDYKKLLSMLVEKYALDNLIGALTVVTPRGIRVRRAHP